MKKIAYHNIDVGDFLLEYVKTVIGVDAHDPNDFLVSNYEYIFKFIEENQINFIVEFNI